MADIAVVGSLNMDLVALAPRAPETGETVSGTGFRTVCGGKGANQAYAAARLGGSMAMIGRVGDDAFGRACVTNLEKAGADCSGVCRTAGTPTGVALIVVDSQARNRIVVVPGSNGLVTPADVRAAGAAIRGAKVLLVQLEIPTDAVEEAMRIAREAGVTVVLDPAPAVPLPPAMIALADIMVPNQHEAAILTGIPVEDRDSALEAAKALRESGVARAVVKLGAGGVMLLDADGPFFTGAFRVEAVDTTAAGDAFAGGLAATLARGKNLREAIRSACAVGALSVTRLGAQDSMPDAEEVRAFLAANPERETPGS